MRIYNMLIVLHSGWIVFPRDDKNKSAAEIGRVNTRTRLMSPDELLSCNQKRIRCKWLARYCLSQWDFSQQFKQLFFVKQSLFPQIPGVGWLYWAFSLDEHPSNPPIQTRCMMQVNASQYFTGFHWNYHACLTGSTYPEKKKRKRKIPSFLCLCERQLLPSTPCNLMMEIYSSFRLTWSIARVISVFWSSSH